MFFDTISQTVTKFGIIEQLIAIRGAGFKIVEITLQIFVECAYCYVEKLELALSKVNNRHFLSYFKLQPLYHKQRRNAICG